jgi:hypothetical protein
VIDAVHPPPSSADLDGLAELLADAVAGGASVSFMHLLSVDAARASA